MLLLQSNPHELLIVLLSIIINFIWKLRKISVSEITYLVDFEVEVNKGYKWNDSQNDNPTPIGICGVDGCGSHRSGFDKGSGHCAVFFFWVVFDFGFEESSYGEH